MFVCAVSQCSHHKETNRDSCANTILQVFSRKWQIIRMVNNMFLHWLLSAIYVVNVKYMYSIHTLSSIRFCDSDKQMWLLCCVLENRIYIRRKLKLALKTQAHILTMQCADCMYNYSRAIHHLYCEVSISTTCYFMMYRRTMSTIGTLTVVVVISMWLQSVETDNISRNYSCPPWYFLDGEGKCTFSHKLPQVLKQYGNTSELQMGFCMTVANSNLVVAQSPYLPVNTHNFSQYHSFYQVLPNQLDQVNNSLCALFNRKGFLCSECKENYGLAAYHYYGLMCVKCSNTGVKWIGFILLLFTPPTIFFLMFLILNINVHSGKLNSFIYFSHIILTTIFFFPALVILPQTLFGYWPFQILLV